MMRLFKWLKRRKQNTRKLFLLTCRIHGSHYYQCLTLVKKNQLKTGEPLLLRREPDNEYDKHAIEVFTLKQQKLGYLPKHNNQVIAALMDQGCRISAVISSIHTTAWEPVTIRIDMCC